MPTPLQKILRYTAAVAGSMIIVATALSLAYDSGLWKLQLLNFPRLFFALSLLVCMLLFFLSKPDYSRWSNRLFLGISIVAIVINGYILAPYLPLVGKKDLADFDKETPATGRELNILVCNVKQENTVAGKVLERVQSAVPDVFLAMETNGPWAEQLAPLETTYPHHMRFIRDNTYGMMLFSKFSLSDSETLFLSHPEVPLFRATVTLPAGNAFRLYCTHPVPPAPSKHPNNTGPQEKEVALKKLAPLVKGETLPVLVAGDLNDVGWSHNMTDFQSASGLSDTRRGRGLYSTFNAQWYFIRWPLDYVFASPNWQVGEIERLEEVGSDHFPYFVKLRLSR